MSFFSRYIEKKIEKQLPEAIRNHFSHDEAMALLYAIIAVRGKFCYFLANKTVETPQKLEFWLNEEKKEVNNYLKSFWKNKPAEEISELVNEFYRK